MSTRYTLYCVAHAFDRVPRADKQAGLADAPVPFFVFVLSLQAPYRASANQSGRISMAKEEAIEMNGTVEEVLRNATFRVLLSNGHYVLATMAGKMRRFRIRVLAGDRVTLAVSPYDLTRGRITFRHK